MRAESRQRVAGMTRTEVRNVLSFWVFKILVVFFYVKHYLSPFLCPGGRQSGVLAVHARCAERGHGETERGEQDEDVFDADAGLQERSIARKAREVSILTSPKVGKNSR